MGVKGLTLLGIVTSSLLVYFCINSNKDRIYAKILAKQSETNSTKKVTNNEKKVLATTPIPAKNSVVATLDPYFRYTPTLLDVNLSKKQKDSLSKEIDKITILDDNLSKNISFDEKIKEFNDISYLEELIVTSKKDKVKNFALTLKGTKVSVSGVLDSNAKLKDFKEILKKLDDKKYDIENNLEVVEAKKEVKIEKAIDKSVDTPKDEIKPKEEPKQIVVQEVIENQAKPQEAHESNDEINITTNKKEVEKEENLVKSVVMPANQEEIKKDEIKKDNKDNIEKEVKQNKKVIKKRVKQRIKKAKKVKKVKKVVKKRRVIKDVRVDDTFLITDKIDKYEANERVKNLLLVEPLEFDLNGGVLSIENKNTLRKIADIIKDIEGSAKVTVNVYTVKGEDDTYNRVLSQKMANRVKSYLIKNGVKSSWIRAYGRGFINPISDPYDDINNRIEIEIN